MHTTEQEILQDILADFLRQKKEKVLYLSLQQKTMPFVHDFVPPTSIIADLSVLDTLFTPVAPFMQYIKDLNPSDETIKTLTYTLQTDSFISYIKTGETSIRKDILQPREIYYEQQRCVDSICRLLDCKGEKLFVIQNAQALGKQATAVIERFEKSDCQSKMIICFDTQRFFSFTHSNQFFTDITNKSSYYEIKSYEAKDSSQKWDSRNILPIHYLARKTTKQLIEIAKNSFYFFSQTEGYFLEKFLQIPNNVKKQSEDDLPELYYYVAYLEMVAGVPDEAVYYLNYALDSEYSKKMEKWILFLFAQIYFVKGNYDNSFFYISSLLSKLEKDNYLYALAKAFELICIDRIRKTITTQEYNEVQELLLKYGLENSRIHTALYFPKDQSLDKFVTIDVQDILNQNIEDAKKIDNEFALARAYQWKGIFFGKTGDLEESLFWQMRSLEIRKVIADLLSTIRSSNGLSYELLVRGNYEEAYTMLNSFMSDLFYITDNSEILVSLYNAAKTFFFMRNYKSAYELFQKCYKLKKVFKLKDFFFCKDSDITAFRAIIDFSVGKKFKAKNSLFNLERNLGKVSAQAAPLVSLLRAFFELEAGELKNATSIIDNVEKECKNIEHQICFIYIEFSIQLLNYNYFSESEVYFSRAMEIAKRYGFQHYLTLYKDANYKNASSFKTNCVPLLVSTKLLEEMFSKQVLIDRVQQKIQDTQFLNSITSIGFKFQTWEEYVKSFGQKLFDFMLAESVSIAYKQDEYWNEVSFPHENFLQLKDFEWDNLLKENSEINILTEIKPNYLFVNLSSYNVSAALVITLSEKSSYTQENQGIIQTAISQLQSALIIFYQREKLKYLSTTDQLTRLNNRRAMKNKMEETCDLIKRLPAPSPLIFVVTFIDLDNFKFYNDTYGHKAGDILLEAFARILTTVYRKVDYICRFGGDEFVILSTDVNSNPARALARLREELAKNDFFITELEQKLKLNIDRETTLKLGFSAGICSNLDVQPIWNLEKTVQYADMALRQAKLKGKNTTYRWVEEDTYKQEICE